MAEEQWHYNQRSLSEMEENGFARLNLGEHPKRSAEGILNYLERHDSEPEINSDEPTRQYRGTHRSHFSKVVNEFVDERINVSMHASIKHKT